MNHWDSLPADLQADIQLRAWRLEHEAKFRRVAKETALTAALFQEFTAMFGPVGFRMGVPRG